MTDPHLRTASIVFKTPPSGDGKEATTTPHVTIKDTNQVLAVDHFAILNTGAYDNADNTLVGGPYSLPIVPGSTVTKGTLDGGSLVVIITTDGDDGWSFSPEVTFVFEGEIEVEYDGDVKYLAVGDGKLVDSGTWTISF